MTSPITASGVWQARVLTNGPKLPSGSQMRYAVLPADPSFSGPRPVLFWLHTNDAGNRSYPNGDPIQVAKICGADGWFNATSFRARGAIVIVPSCDQTTDPGGTMQNFAGYGPVNAVNEQSLVILAQYAVSALGGDPNQILVAGGSLGGIACWGLAIDHNAKTGTITKTFTAFLAEAGMLVRSGVTPASVLAQLHDVPIFALHGASDTTSPIGWDRGIWDGFSGGKPRPGAPGARAGGSAFWYLEDAKLGHDVWDTYSPAGAGGPQYDWLFAQRSTGVIVTDPFTPSPDLTTLQAGSTNAITDAAGNAWTITAAGLIAVNGGDDTTTANVTVLAIVRGVIWQQNLAGNWYSKTSPDAAWVGPTTVNPLQPVVIPPTSGFRVRGGKIYRPDGTLFRAQGINNRPTDNSNAAAILRLFPGLTYVRLAMDSFVNPADWNGFVSLMEAAKVACLFEYHPWPMQNALSGAALAAEAAWAGSVAKYFQDRPYVWVGSMNEPQGGVMTPEHTAVYDAVRAADTNKLVVLVCGIGGGNPGKVGAGSLGTTAYLKCTNIVWDLHSYGWSSKYSTDQSVVSALLAGSAATNTGVAGAQAIQSADGVVPVIAGEFGPSTSGTAMDLNAAQVIKAVLDDPTLSGWAGWAWAADPFNALQKGGVLTAWGAQLAAAMAPPVVVVKPPIVVVTPESIAVKVLALKLAAATAATALAAATAVGADDIAADLATLQRQGG